MKKIFTSYLFNHQTLVATKTPKAEEAFATRLLMESAWGVEITDGKELAMPELIPYVADQLGRNVPAPFYKGFPDSVRELSPDELLFDQLLSYARTYGVEDFSRPVYSLLEEQIEREDFNEKTETKKFRIVKEEAAVQILSEYFNDLLKGTRPLNSSQFETLCEYAKEYNYNIENCASKNTAIKLLLTTKNVYYTRFLALPDVIKIVDELNFTEYGNKKLNKLNLKNQDRKFITKILNEILRRNPISYTDCYEQKKNWAGLLHHIHYSPKNENAKGFVAAMRGNENHSVYSTFENLMCHSLIDAAKFLTVCKGSGALLRNLDYIISRATRSEIPQIIDLIDGKNKIVLLQLLLKYNDYNGVARREFVFTKHNMTRIHRETPDEMEKRGTILSEITATRLFDAIYDKIREAYKGTLGKVYISPIMEKYALPINESTSFGGFGVLAKGTRIAIPEGKKIRAFTYWEKVNDIDLSVIGLDSEGKQTEFSWRTMYRGQSDMITYSGDVTSGFNGGSEYFDIDIPAFKKAYLGIKHLVLCDNVYSHMNFNECYCTAGYMLRDVLDTGEIYEPKTVKTSYRVNSESTFAYLFAIDLEKNELIWLNVAREGSCHVAGASSVNFLKKYFNVTEAINLKSFFEMLATEVVSNPAEADIVVSDTEIGKETIRSYDFEKIMALMN